MGVGRDGGAPRRRSAIGWWAGISRSMVAGDFPAVDAAVAAVLTAHARGAALPADQLALAWAGAAAVAGLRGQGAGAEDAFATALRLAETADDERCAALVRIARAECTFAERPARAIDDARRVLGASHLSPVILHQARYALIAGHRAAGDFPVAIALGERLLACDLSVMERGRALAAHAVTLLAAEQRDPALEALDESARRFHESGAEFFAASVESTLARLDPSRRDELLARAGRRAGRHADDPAWRRVLELPYPLLEAPPTVVPSARELVVALVARGFTSRQVADALLIRPSTVESHIRRSMELSGATSRAQLIGAHTAASEAQWLSLRPSERELLELVAGGCTTKDIALRLHLSPRTVTRRLHALRDRFGVASTPALVAAAGSSAVGVDGVGP
jgi:DNA-binding CsgD family transcriptional regulator